MKEQQLTELLHDMSLQEKIDQMFQVMGLFFTENEEGTLTGPAQNFGVDVKDLQSAGTILGSYGADTLKAIQDKAMSVQPHHIPMLFMLDVIHGLKTIFPAPLAQGATFDPALSGECAAAAAREAAASGLHVTFAPMVDLVRDARWGRVVESTGEDPYLNRLFAAEIVKGFQGDDVKASGKIAACVKHFAAYGAAQAGRDYNTVELCERTLRDYYLPSYKAAVDAGVKLVMTSFNTVNDIPATGNQWLMKEILRKEFGFDGVLITDFTAIPEMIRHGYAADERDAALKAIQAGVDIDMMSGCYAGNLKSLVEDGEVDESAIDECVLRILKLKNDLGLFENPYKDADAEKEKEVILCKEHRALARKAASESFVLLKNDGLLPLDLSKKIAFIGPYTQNRELQSSWAFTGDPKDTVSIQGAAEECMDASRTSFTPGCPVLGNDVVLTGFTGSVNQTFSAEELSEMKAAAIQAAREAELVVMPLGEHFLQSGEATSRAFLDLPEIQMELFRAVYEVNPNIVVVLFNGRPLDLREISQKAGAILEVWLPGTEGGHAILDVLTGKTAPQGKLPMSFPYCVGQLPVSYNHFATGRPVGPNADPRFSSKYTDIPNEPLYPFGFGLSYTDFSVSGVSLSDTVLGKDSAANSLQASVEVENTGSFAGTETIQLYLQDVTASVVRPVKELKGFRKETLQHGEKKTVSFTITPDMLAFTRADGSFGSEPGLFRVMIGNSSAVSEYAEFTLE